MKKILILLITIFFLGCSNKESLTKINLIDNLNYEFNEKVYLYDLFTIKNGTIITGNYQINTLNIGSNEISFKYYDSNNRKQKYSFKINVQDTTKPIILASNKMYVKVGDNINIVDKIVALDNYDENVKKYVIGNYDFNVKGEYNLKFVATDRYNNQSTRDFKLIVTDTLPKSTNKAIIKIEDAIKKYKSKNTTIGIDVSKWQGDIDYEKVKNDGVEFVIIRIGYGHVDGKNQMDNYFLDNIKKAKDAGLKVGIYFYSYAKTINEAKEQAKWIVKTLNGEKLDLPVAFDWEVWSNFNKYELSIYELNQIADTFLKEIEKNDYKGMLYSSKHYLENVWDLPNYPTWLAHYTDKTDYQQDYYIWQASSTLRIDGINGNVDLNIMYNK